MLHKTKLYTCLPACSHPARNAAQCVRTPSPGCSLLVDRTDVMCLPSAPVLLSLERGWYTRQGRASAGVYAMHVREALHNASIPACQGALCWLIEDTQSSVRPALWERTAHPRVLHGPRDHFTDLPATCGSSANKGDRTPHLVCSWLISSPDPERDQQVAAFRTDALMRRTRANAHGLRNKVDFCAHGALLAPSLFALFYGQWIR
jgi:hypothetical protein